MFLIKIILKEEINLFFQRPNYNVANEKVFLKDKLNTISKKLPM